MTSCERFARFYKVVALHTFNSLILILVINLVMAGVLFISAFWMYPPLSTESIFPLPA